MIVKGLVSAIDMESKTVSVILPEYNNIVTKPIKVYGNNGIESLQVNDFVMVVVFNDDFNDLMVIVPKGASAILEYYQGQYSITPKVDSQTLPTSQKFLDNDITVQQIPFYNVGNTSGGNTVYIGSELETE